MQITFYYNQGQGKYGAELYVKGTEKVNLYFTGDMQITYFVRMIRDVSNHNCFSSIDYRCYEAVFEAASSTSVGILAV